MQNIYDLAVLELAELLASARNAGAPCQPARQQDEHGPAGDEEKELIGVHGSVPRDVAVDQVQADQQHSGRAKDDEAEKFVEVHLSLLVVVATLREPEIEAVANHADRDGAEDVDEEGHGRSLLVRTLKERRANSPEEPTNREAAHEGQHIELDAGHGSCRLEFWPLLAERLREHLLPRDGLLGLLLNSNRKLGRGQLVAVGHIAHVALRGAAFVSEGLAVLVAHREEVGFQVHAPLHHLVFGVSTPFGVLLLVYCRA